MMALGAFFRGGDRSKPPTVPWQTTAALVLGATLVVSQQLVAGAAGLGAQTGSLHADRIASTTLALFASVGSIALLVVGLILSILEARLRRSLRRAESELQRRSFRDGLTRLPNRLMFEGTLAQAVQQADATGERMAMLFIDLDGFKPVNDSLGHRIGDLVLREVATPPEALRPARRPGGAPRRRRVPDADPRQPERRGRGHRRRARCRARSASRARWTAARPRSRARSASRSIPSTAATPS